MVATNYTECNRKLRAARVKAGLRLSDYKAKGRYRSDGTWVEERKAERTLDDAFEIRGKESAGAGGGDAASGD